MRNVTQVRSVVFQGSFEREVCQVVQHENDGQGQDHHRSEVVLQTGGHVYAQAQSVEESDEDVGSSNAVLLELGLELAKLLSLSELQVQEDERVEC